MTALNEGHFPGGTAAGPRHVLVTGGTGFIGHALVLALAAQGLRVTVLSRRDRLPPALRQGQVHGVQTLGEIPSHERVDAVINLAGARILGLPWTTRRRQQLLRSRVVLTQELVNWIDQRSQRPGCLLSASAIGYYGVQPLGEDAPLTEDSPPQPVFMSQLCEQWERAAAAAAPLGVRVACLRFGLVLGHGGALPMLLLPVRMGVGGRLGSGRQWLSWVHIEDVVRALAHTWHALEEGPAEGPRVYNVTAPEAVRQAEFSRIAAAVLRRPSFVPTPAWPVRLLLGEQSDLLLEGQRVAPARLQREGFVFHHPTLRAALQDLVSSGPRTLRPG